MSMIQMSNHLDLLLSRGDIMEILFLGTGAGIPGKARNVSSLALRLHDEINETWLFDCGEGTQQQILKTNVRPKKITNIFITHMHGDHIYGLPGFLSSRSFQGGEDKMTVYGPPGIRDYIQMNLKLSQTRLLYPLDIIELNPEGGKIQTSSGWEIEYLPLQHGILCFGYRIIEPDKDGELLMDKLVQYQIPNGPILGQLKRGEIVTLDNGTVLDGKDFVGEDKKGRIVTILGDTRPCENSERLAQGANVLVHEGTHSHQEAKMARQYFHSTNVQAAKIARNAQVKLLLLNHVSARYLKADTHQLEKEAQEIFPNTHIASDFKSFVIE